jgi:crotonobetainyl-CoA:carnitine CoA-transferase CaiB-like acyl-CoA transferase
MIRSFGSMTLSFRSKGPAASSRRRQHNEAVLEQLGFNAAEIAALRASGAVPEEKGSAA